MADQTKKMGETKRQHYVPRFVLRGFSADQKTTSVMLLADGRVVQKASIKEQCAEDYFYGAGQSLERSFAKEEAKIAGYLGIRDRATLEAFSEDVLWDFKSFLHYQHARTLAAAERFEHFLASMARSVMLATARLNNEPPDYVRTIENLKVLKNPQVERIWYACKSRPVIADLNIKFIMTERAEGFVVGDHPVVAYNQFAEHHPVLRRFPTITSLAVKGLQYFMPLSSSVVLAAYDPVVYKYGGNSVVCRAGPRDVKFLNAMQAVNSLKCVYFDRKRVQQSDLDELLAKQRSHPSVHKTDISTSPFNVCGDGRLSRFMVSSYRDVRVGAKLSFVKVLDGHSYRDYSGASLPVRSPQLMEIAKAYGEHLDEEFEREQERRKTCEANPDAHQRSDQER